MSLQRGKEKKNWISFFITLIRHLCLPIYLILLFIYFNHIHLLSKSKLPHELLLNIINLYNKIFGKERELFLKKFFFATSWQYSLIKLFKILSLKDRCGNILLQFKKNIYIFYKNRVMTKLLSFQIKILRLNFLSLTMIWKNEKKKNTPFKINTRFVYWKWRPLWMDPQLQWHYIFLEN